MNPAENQDIGNHVIDKQYKDLRLNKQADKKLTPSHRKTLDVKEINTLYLNGFDANEINEETGISITLIKTTIKKIEKDISNLSKGELFSILRNKLVQMMDAHNRVSAEHMRHFLRLSNEAESGKDTSALGRMMKVADNLTRIDSRFASFLQSMGVATVGLNLIPSTPSEGSTESDNSLSSDRVLIGSAGKMTKEGIEDSIKEMLVHMKDHFAITDKLRKVKYDSVIDVEDTRDLNI